MLMTKPRIGIFGITGCMGCQLNIIYQDKLLDILGKIDLVSFQVAKGQNHTDGPFDAVFLEGVIVNKEELEFVKQLREKTKLLIAIGSCATDGCIPQIKNFMDKKQVETAVYPKDPCLKPIDPAPIDKHVKVDFYIRGCPMDLEEFEWFITEFLAGKIPKQYEKSVCHNCNLYENHCLLEKDIPCVGPITIGNCSVMCPNMGKQCTGCRGIYTDANIAEFEELLKEKGFSKQRIAQLINKYAGLKAEEQIETEEEECHCCVDMYCHPLKGESKRRIHRPEDGDYKP